MQRTKGVEEIKVSDVARIYHPVRDYYHIDEAELYIDHSDHQNAWGKAKQWVREKWTLVRSKYTHLKSTWTKNIQKDEQIERQLRRTGLSGIDLLKPEVKQVGKFLHSDEEILASMIGRNDDGGNGLMIITGTRIIYLDVIPLFVKMDEVAYELVTGVSTEVGMLGASVTLHTGVKDFTLHHVNPSAAAHFVGVTEMASLSRLTPLGNR